MISLLALAQEPPEKMETDRPDQTESPSIVPKDWLQFESGIVREQRSDGALYTLPTLLSKYGVLKKLELRLITEYTSLYRQHFTDSFGLSPIAVGFKYNLIEEHGLMPQISFIAHNHFNRLASRHYKGLTFFATAFRFTMQHTLSSHIGLGYNLGTEWESTDAPPAWIYTLAPGIEWAGNWYAYIEVFGSVRKGEKPEHNFDGGLAYHLSDNMRADLSAGVGLTQNSFDHYVALGFSFRVAASKKLSIAAP
jgi:hypothetical protein